MADQINVGKQVFNEPGELFDSDTSPRVVRYLQQLRPDRSAIEGIVPNEPPDPTPRDTEDPIPRTSAVGSFSGVRAARIMHQHRIGFWTFGDVLPYVAQSQQADPTEDEIDQMYDDLLLFNYLPNSMTPTRAEFGEMTKPSKREAFIRSRLSELGVLLDQNAEVSNAVTAAAPQQIIPAPPPFAERLSTFCLNKFYEEFRNG